MFGIFYLSSSLRQSTSNSVRVPVYERRGRPKKYYQHFLGSSEAGTFRFDPMLKTPPSAASVCNKLTDINIHSSWPYRLSRFEVLLFFILKTESCNDSFWSNLMQVHCCCSFRYGLWQHIQMVSRLEQKLSVLLRYRIPNKHSGLTSLMIFSCFTPIKR